MVDTHARWVAILTDGSQKDQNELSWECLRSLCQTKGLAVKELWLQFRSHRVQIPIEEGKGVYLARSAFGFWGNEESYHGIVTGIFDGEKAHTTHYKLPEIIPLQHQIREIDENSPHLILTPQLANL
jgi:hypothetical protein